MRKKSGFISKIYLLELFITRANIRKDFFSFQIAKKQEWNICNILITILITLLLFVIALFKVTISSFVMEKNILLKQLYIDDLTGLFNNRMFAKTMKKINQEKKIFALIYLDLDHFKNVNDCYGHDVGDKLLIKVGKRLKKCVGKRALVFRKGGDEFAIVIYHKKPMDFYDKLILIIHKIIDHPFMIDQYKIKTHISCGYARYPEDSNKMEDIIKKADLRMYEMKKEERLHQ